MDIVIYAPTPVPVVVAAAPAAALVVTILPVAEVAVVVVVGGGLVRSIGSGINDFIYDVDLLIASVFSPSILLTSIDCDVVVLI